MYFPVDQDVYLSTINLLLKWEHDVITAKEINMACAKDEDLLRKAREMNRIFITRDKDFGALVFLKNTDSGVILIRITPSTIEEVHTELNCLLKEHTEEELHHLFSVVEPNRYRLRQIN